MEYKCSIWIACLFMQCENIERFARWSKAGTLRQILYFLKILIYLPYNGKFTSDKSYIVLVFNLYSERSHYIYLPKNHFQ